MQALVVVFLGALVVGFALFVGSILGACLGAISGYIVGWLFDDSMAHLIKFLGTDAAPYQIGAMLGFVGGFFRALTTTK